MTAEPVWIAGVGMTPFGVHLERSVKQLTADAVTPALADAGAAPGDVEAAFFGNTAQGALEGQVAIGGPVALRAMGFEGIPVVNVESACATGAVALHLAVNAVRAGEADVALAVGVEKFHGHDPEVVRRLFAGGVDVHDLEGLRRMLCDLGGAAEDGGGHRTLFMDLYAAMTRRHMARFGTTQRQLAVVAEKNHRHALANERAHYRLSMTVDEILAARSLAYPLTVPMCSPMTDGAAAAVVCNQGGLSRLKAARPVRVLASVIRTGVERGIDDDDRYITRLAAQRAYEMAGVGPEDISVAEVHDAAAFGEILQTEMLGFCAPGTGGVLAESGATTLGGHIPINPSGGLESKGHPVAATGLGQIFELTEQLRGAAGERQVPGARLALAENGGGMINAEEAVAAVTILGA